MVRPGVPGPPVGCEPFIPIPQGVPAQTAWRGLGAGQPLYSEQPLEGAPTMQCTWEFGETGTHFQALPLSYWNFPRACFLIR